MGCLFRQLLFADKNAVPLMRTIPMPPVPMGVEIAAITSSSMYSLFIETSFLEGLCPSNFLQGESFPLTPICRNYRFCENKLLYFCAAGK